MEDKLEIDINLWVTDFYSTEEDKVQRIIIIKQLIKGTLQTILFLNRKLASTVRRRDSLL
jgi:hypothetical protein